MVSDQTDQLYPQCINEIGANRRKINEFSVNVTKTKNHKFYRLFNINI